jgi:hypothetical protein
MSAVYGVHSGQACLKFILENFPVSFFWIYGLEFSLNSKVFNSSWDQSSLFYFTGNLLSFVCYIDSLIWKVNGWQGHAIFRKDLL